MALLEEQFTEKLETGAPDITYEGEEGREQQIAQALWDKLPAQMRMQFGSFNQFFSSGAWKKVLAALQQQMQEGGEEIQQTTEVMEPAAQQGLGSLMQGPRPMAHGGIAGLDGRQAYGLGSIFKSITKPIKKVLKSDIGKAAALYALTAGAGNLAAGAAGGTGQAWTGGKWLLPSNAFGLGQAGLGNLGTLGGKMFLSDPSKGFSLANISPWKAGAALTAAPFAMQAMGKWDQPTLDDLKLKAGKFGFNYEQMIRDIQNAETEEEYLAVLAEYNLSASDLPPWGSQKRAEGGRIGYQDGGGSRDPLFQDVSRWLFAKDVDTLTDDEYDTLIKFMREGSAHGGRIGRQEGGLMDLGGMEKDYRNDGGFVPLGGEEKADDVPARLSRNEFVFTADAVRNAGGGDIDQGAEIMENVMKNLERGGEISEESQGLGGARDMFATSERLSEVV